LFTTKKPKNSKKSTKIISIQKFI